MQMEITNNYQPSCFLPTFQVFYWTHLMYLLYAMILLLHGPRFFWWFFIPGIIFAFERISQIMHAKNSQYGKTYVKQVNLLPSGVSKILLIIIITLRTLTLPPPPPPQQPTCSIYTWHTTEQNFTTLFTFLDLLLYLTCFVLLFDTCMTV